MKEFRTKHTDAYNAVLRYCWQDVLTQLPRSRRSANFWTHQAVANQARKYKTRTAFHDGCEAAYMAAYREGWLDDICAHMVSTQKPSGYWSKKRVFEEAKRHHSRTIFQKRAGGAYTVAFRGGYLDKVCAHMETVGNRYKRAIYAFEFEDHSVYIGLTFNYDVRYREHFTQDKQVGRKLKTTPAKFIRFNKWLSLDEAGKAEAETIEDYRRRGWTILNKMKPGGVGSRPEKWPYEEVKKILGRYKTVKGFKTANLSAYVVAHRKGWWPKLSRHMKRSIEHGKWTLKAVRMESLQYSNRRDFGKGAPGAYDKARKSGWLDAVCRHMERLVKPVNYWTYETVAKEAGKYKTRSHFQKCSGGAYQKAFRQGWLDKVCAHMSSIHKPNGYWTLVHVTDEAKKYRTRRDFQRGAPGAYQRAHKDGWLDDVCQHMKEFRKQAGYWTKKRILQETSKFTSLKEFRDSPGGAYDAAYKLGLMPLLQHQLIMDKKPNGYWTLSRVKNAARKYTSRVEFIRGASSAYSKAHRNGWLDEVCAHMSNSK